MTLTNTGCLTGMSSKMAWRIQLARDGLILTRMLPLIWFQLKNGDTIKIDSGKMLIGLLKESEINIYGEKGALIMNARKKNGAEGHHRLEDEKNRNRQNAEDVDKAWIKNFLLLKQFDMNYFLTRIRKMNSSHSII